MSGHGKKSIVILSAAALLVAAAIISIIVFKPWFRYYYSYGRQISLSPAGMIRHYGKPDKEKDWLLGLCVEADRGDWDKLAEMTAEDRKSELGTYFHNLANAAMGRLPDCLMDYYQPFERGLFLPVNESSTPFVIAQSGEVWYRLGELTMAEHSAMLGMAFSPNKSGEKFLRRLADINFINGDTEATMKYARLLGEYPEWTADKMQIKACLPQEDIIHSAGNIRPVLKNLLRSNSANLMAYQYLLCFDLLVKDIGAFIEDYDGNMPSSRLYEEAALIYMAANDAVTPDNLLKYNISGSTWEDFNSYSEAYKANEGKGQALQERFGKSYWFYYHYAQRNDKE